MTTHKDVCRNNSVNEKKSQSSFQAADLKP